MSRRARYKDSTIVSSPAFVTLSFLHRCIHRCSCSFGKVSTNYLDSGLPGAPGPVGDFLSFYLSNIVRFVFQNFVFMPCQVTMRKTNVLARRYPYWATLLHVCSSTSKLGCQFLFRGEYANYHKHERMRRKCLLWEMLLTCT